MSGTQSDERGLIVSCPACSQANRIAYERLGQLPRCAKCQTRLALPAQPVDLPTDAVFRALVSRSSLPVLVDFWAAWCGPCKMIAPEVAKVAAAGVGRWLVAKADTEVLMESAQTFSVSSIPLLVLFREGRERARQAGALPAAAIRQFVEQHL